MIRKIVLASQSPRRKQILEWAEIPFEIIVPNADESYPETLSVGDIPIYIANAKINAVKDNLEINPELPLVAADTIVVLGREVIGKPKDEQEAFDMLKKLSGKIHRVITGVCIYYDKRMTTFSETTEVEFKTLSDQQIQYYIEKYKPYDKAGAYAIQEWIGITGIKSIKGDFYNVMGLPAGRLWEKLSIL